MSEPGRYDQLTIADFNRLAQFVQGYCGIQITSRKRTMLENRLQRRMKARGITSIDEYCSMLFGDDDAEVVAFINEITTNKTDFFREPSHFEFLTEEIVPRIVHSGRRDLKIWSAASSMGAEAYTCAMVLEDFRRKHDLTYSILATDIATDVLQTGLAGRYPIIMMEPIPESYRQRYVMLSRDPKRREFRITPELRQKVAFRRLNLMDEAYPVAKDFDVIFCRNILIYFDQATQTRVLARLCRHLRSDGYLITGHSETIRDASLPLSPVSGGTIHQRKDSRVSVPQMPPIEGRFPLG